LDVIITESEIDESLEKVLEFIGDIIQTSEFLRNEQSVIDFLDEVTVAAKDQAEFRNNQRLNSSNVG